MAKGKHFCEGLQVAKSVQLKPWPKPMKMSTPSLVCWPRVAIKSENWEMRTVFSQLRIRSCRMSIMAFELPIVEMAFALSEFEFKVFT